MALDSDQRRRMREAAEAAALEAPGEWRTGENGQPFFRGFSAVTCDVDDEHGLDHRILLTYNHHFDYEGCARFAAATQPSTVLALLDALEQTERERDALRERLAAELERPIAPPLSWADVCRLQAQFDELNATGGDRGDIERAERDLAAAKSAWGLGANDRPVMANR